jgi:hypothetical protein
MSNFATITSASSSSIFDVCALASRLPPLPRHATFQYVQKPSQTIETDRSQRHRYGRIRALTAIPATRCCANCSKQRTATFTSDGSGGRLERVMPGGTMRLRCRKLSRRWRWSTRSATDVLLAQWAKTAAIEARGTGQRSGMPNEDGFDLIRPLRAAAHEASGLHASALTAFVRKHEAHFALLAVLRSTCRSRRRPHVDHSQARGAPP